MNQGGKARNYRSACAALGSTSVQDSPRRSKNLLTHEDEIG